MAEPFKNLFSLELIAGLAGHMARAAGEVGRICAELVFGYNRHPAWDKAGCESCYSADDLESLESVMPGISVSARGMTDVIERDGSHP